MKKYPSLRVSSVVVALTAITLSVSRLAAVAPPLEAGPDPREIPLPVIKTSMAKLPGVKELPVRKELPDIMTMNDGTKVKTLEQWKQRRQEMLQILEYYSVGQAPPPPGNVKGKELQSQLVANGKIKYRLVHLTFGPEEKLYLDIGIFTPVEGGPFPTVIAQANTPPGGTPQPRVGNGPTQGRGQDVLLLVGKTIPPELVEESGGGRAGRGGGAPAAASAGDAPPGAIPAAPPAARGGGRGGANDPERIAATNAALARGYAYVMYSNNDCAEDTTLREPDGSWSYRKAGFLPAYPNYDWGALRVWAWGASRVADYLETDPSIDKKKLIITGASRTGKSAMVAAAFDDRLMGAPVVTGGGGVGAYRFAGASNSESLDMMQRKYPNWWGPNLHQFWGHKEKLPFDEHWFLALCAPRPFLALEGDADTISLPEAVKQSILAARPAYALYGVPDRLGVHYSHHGHAFTAEDWTAMLNFADKHYLGKRDFTFDYFLTLEEREAATAATAAAAAPARGGAARPPAGPE